MNGRDYLESLPKWTGVETFDLTNISKVVEYLGMPQDHVRSVHVAGTNGKGSVSSSIAAILGAAGNQTGLNTSPNLEILNERFVVDGVELDDTTINSALDQVKAANLATGITPSYHEGLTIAAFLLFKPLDWAVYEVGLGGRGDASNVISSPQITVITSIGYDHQAILGDTIEKIAFEKAGIIKPQVPVVLGKMSEQALQVIELVAKKHSAPVFKFSKDFHSKSHDLSHYTYQDNTIEFNFECSLIGAHQLSNLACAIKVALLCGVSVSDCQSGLKHLFWPGRHEQVVYRNKKFILDCAHNIDGIRALIETTRDNHSNQLIILGMLQRPDWQEILMAIAATWRKVVVVTAPTARAIPSSELSAFLSCAGVNVLDFNSDYKAAIEFAEQSAFSEIAVAGSIYLVGAIRALFDLPKKPLWLMQKI